MCQDKWIEIQVHFYVGSDMKFVEERTKERKSTLALLCRRHRLLAGCFISVTALLLAGFTLKPPTYTPTASPDFRELLQNLEMENSDLLRKEGIDMAHVIPAMRVLTNISRTLGLTYSQSQPNPLLLNILSKLDRIRTNETTDQSGSFKPSADSDSENNADSQLNSCQASLEELAAMYKVPGVSCEEVILGDQSAMAAALNATKTMKRELLPNEYYLSLTQNCDGFKTSRGYVTCPLTQEESEFPIAYSIVTYKDIEMVERLLRVIYRPQNFYCIHVDKKSEKDFLRTMRSISGCFDNVFLTSDLVDVKWGEFSVLEPEIICMKLLWSHKKWKYFINLTGQEFPLKTNFELVKILKAYNGANDLEGTVKRANNYRWNNSPPPRGLRPVKGSVHITVNRDFVDYILHNDTAQELLAWVRGTGVPDETFFATLNHNPQLGIRGSYKGDPETESSDSMVKPFLTRFKNWGSDPFKFHCAGQHVRGICILSTGDLPQLGQAKHLFANKFYLHEDKVVIGCLEEKLFNNTRDEYSGTLQFNTTYYSNLGFVKDQVT
ncbi:unnamed protein product [Lymnaea stagnalis]|uniref:Beta-1,3-galactosyl-O-glycosyl-glycoprotein beta-1,6-N-acetylglucosaminyltransferase n=1 Tax=Lymnaea stagnalis TaxID=6523 RepID=A0AAV2I9K3_LYMST